MKKSINIVFIVVLFISMLNIPAINALGQINRSQGDLSITNTDEIIISNLIFSSIEKYYAPDIQTLFEENKSGLANYYVVINGKKITAAEIIMNSSIGRDYYVNPKLLITMLEAVSELVTNSTPSQFKLDKAMGNSDPTYNGFEKQVLWAAKTLGHDYENIYFDLQYIQRNQAATLALIEFAKFYDDRTLPDLLHGQSLKASSCNLPKPFWEFFFSFTRRCR